MITIIILREAGCQNTKQLWTTFTDAPIKLYNISDAFMKQPKILTVPAVVSDLSCSCYVIVFYLVSVSSDCFGSPCSVLK